jgi:hypothetical protein
MTIAKVSMYLFADVERKGPSIRRDLKKEKCFVDQNAKIVLTPLGWSVLKLFDTGIVGLTTSLHKTVVVREASRQYVEGVGVWRERMFVECSPILHGRH